MRLAFIVGPFLVFAIAGIALWRRYRSLPSLLVAIGFSVDFLNLIAKCRMLMQCILVASKIVLGDVRLPILFYLLTALRFRYFNPYRIDKVKSCELSP